MSLFLLTMICMPDDGPAQLRALPAEKVASLQRALEGAVFTALPTPLNEGKSHWGETKKSVNGLKWTSKPELQFGNRNHGTWRKYVVALDTPVKDHLRLRVSNVQNVGHNTLTFQVEVEADVHFDVQQQNWATGVKLFDGSARGSASVKMNMNFESKLIIEPTTSFLPTIKYRMRVVQANTDLEKIVFTHVPGLGGTAAKVVGNWTMDAMQKIKPSLESNLLDKLTQKLVKAADTKEIQLSLAGVERKK